MPLSLFRYINDRDGPGEPPYMPDAWHSWLARTTLSAGRPYVQLPLLRFENLEIANFTGNRRWPVATTIKLLASLYLFNGKPIR